MLQAQKEADALAKAKKKEFKEKEAAQSETPDRPSLPHSLSSDSVRAASAEGDDASEAGGDQETSASTPTPRESPVPRRSRKGAKPRKSKLAQEIIPDPEESVPGTPAEEEVKVEA